MENESEKKIRLGNDIRLKVSLETVDHNPLTIQSLHAIIINTTLKDKEEADRKKKTNFIKRYPIEPMFEGYDADKYHLNNSGYPEYRVMPGSSIPSRYRGFGLYPAWNEIYKPCMSHKLYEYHAPVQYDPQDLNVVDIDFPADAQLFTGNYQLTIVAKVLNTGYTGNSRTITIDYPNVFDLVDSTNEANYPGDVIIIELED